MTTRNTTTSQLSRISPKDVESISFDAEDEQLTVEFLVPIDGGMDHATFVSMHDCSGEDPAEAHIVSLLRQLLHEVSASVRTQKERQSTQPVPCETCTSACCSNTVIRVLPEDIERLQAAEVDVSGIKRFATPTALGFVGMIDASEGSCIYLTEQGCSVYNHRPTICREYSAWTCSVYEEDPEKTAGRRRLLVVQQ